MADIDELKKKLEDGWIKGEPYVFVSYASKDKEKVYEFVYELRKRGINVYIDIELQENISKNWLQNIKERLYDVDCVAMISFLSLNYFRSYACLIEQLVTRSEDLKMEKGRYLENFYIALDDNMSTIQKMEDAVYDNTVAKESQSMAIKMVPEEVNVLKDVMEDNIDKTQHQFAVNQLIRLKEKKCTTENSVIYTKILTDFERIGDHGLNIAESLYHIRKIMKQLKMIKPETNV